MVIYVKCVKCVKCVKFLIIRHPWQPVPGASGKIGNGHRLAFIRHRGAGKFNNGTPFGGIVHVHVQREAVAQAIHQAVIQDDIHAPVPPYIPGLLSHFPYNGMCVEPQQLIQYIRCHKAMGIGLQRNPGYRVFLRKTFGAADYVYATVRPRAGYIVLQHDGAVSYTHLTLPTIYSV